jgi:hypothetical protein
MVAFLLAQVARTEMLTKQNDELKHESGKLQAALQEQLKAAAASAKTLGSLQQECAFLIILELPSDSVVL